MQTIVFLKRMTVTVSSIAAPNDTLGDWRMKCARTWLCLSTLQCSCECGIHEIHGYLAERSSARSQKASLSADRYSDRHHTAMEYNHADTAAEIFINLSRIVLLMTEMRIGRSYQGRNEGQRGQPILAPLDTTIYYVSNGKLVKHNPMTRAETPYRLPLF